MVDYSCVSIVKIEDSDKRGCEVFNNLAFDDAKKKSMLLDKTIAGHILTRTLKEKSLYFLSYQDFRNDKFEKNSPFDGLLFNESNKNLAKESMNFVRENIAGSKLGSLSEDGKQWLINRGIKTVELIISTVSDKVRDKSIFNSIRDYNQALAEELLEGSFYKVSSFPNENDLANSFKEFAYNLKDSGYIENSNQLLEADVDDMCDYQIAVSFDKRDENAFLLSVAENVELVKEENFKCSESKSGKKVMWYNMGFRSGKNPFDIKIENKKVIEKIVQETPAPKKEDVIKIKEIGSSKKEEIVKVKEIGSSNMKQVEIKPVKAEENKKVSEEDDLDDAFDRLF